MKFKSPLPIFLIFVAIIAVHSGAQTSEISGIFFNVKEFGAIGDGKYMDTQAIQATIDSCHRANGGTVYFPPGIYLSGSIHLKSNVALYLDHGATLMASLDDADFDPYEELGFENDADHETSYFHFALIWGEDVERIAISGTGTIDGNRSKRGGPKPIALKRCKNVTIKDITILNAPNYAISMLGTENAAAIISLNNVQDTIIRNCTPPESTNTFLNVSGNQSERIILLNNNLQGVTDVFNKSDDVGDKAIRELYNY